MINETNRHLANELYHWNFLVEEAKQTESVCLGVFIEAVESCIEDARDAGLSEAEVEDILRKSKNEAYELDENLELVVM